MPRKPPKTVLTLIGDDDDDPSAIPLVADLDDDDLDLDEEDDEEAREPEVYSVKDLKRHAREIVDDLNGTLPMAYITIHEEPKAVIISYDTFQMFSSLMQEMLDKEDGDEVDDDEDTEVIVLDQNNADIFGHEGDDQNTDDEHEVGEGGQAK